MKNKKALMDGEIMKAKAPVSISETKRAWSTFPRGHWMRTQRPAGCNEAPAKTIVQEERNETSFQPLDEYVRTSLRDLLESTNNQEERDQYLLALASFFASSASQDAKLARLRILMTLVTPKEASWQLDNVVIKATLHFLTRRMFVWMYPEHSARVLLWELRAMCLWEIERRSFIVRGSEVTAGCIFGAARLVEYGLASSVPLIHGGLDFAGTQVKTLLTPQQPLMNTRDQVVTRTYTDAAKRATDGVRQTVRWTAFSLRDASIESIHNMARKFEQGQLGERLVPDQGHRELLLAAGKVGLATLGAAAIVGEATFDTTRAVAQKVSFVTADVVRYKYGENAGRMVEDASHTTGNILRTAAHIAYFEASVLAKAVAKNAGRGQEDWSPPDLTGLEPAIWKGSLHALEASRIIAPMSELELQSATKNAGEMKKTTDSSLSS